MPAATPLVCLFTIDAPSFPNALTQMRAKMATVCPAMPFDFTVTCVPGDGAKWRFTFQVVFSVSSHEANGGA